MTGFRQLCAAQRVSKMWKVRVHTIRWLRRNEKRLVGKTTKLLVLTWTAQRCRHITLLSLPDSKRYSVCIWFKHKGPWQYIVIWQTENENGLLISKTAVVIKNGFVRLHYQTKHMCPRKIQLRNSTESLYRHRRTGWCDWTAVFFSCLISFCRLFLDVTLCVWLFIELWFSNYSNCLTQWQPSWDPSRWVKRLWQLAINTGGKRAKWSADLSVRGQP